MLMPAFALADNPPPKSHCRFSKMIEEQNVVTAKNCSEKLCSHVVICEKKDDPKGQAEMVVCKAQNGQCNGYTANDCYDNRITEKAEYE